MHTQFRLFRVMLLAVVLGSCGEDPVSNDNEPDCDPSDASGCWELLSPAPTKRQELQPATLDGKVYLVGGLSGTSFEDLEVLSTVDVYDPATDSWSSTAPLPEARHHVAVASMNGKLFAFGGMTGRQPSRWTEHSSSLVFDPSANAWSPIAPMPTPRGEHLAVTHSGKIYVIGGRAAGLDTGLNEVYDPASDSWSTLAPMPTPRRSFAAAILDSLIVIAGGRLSPDGTGLTNSDVVEAYSPTSNRWHQLRKITTGRGGLALGSLKGRLYVMGGENLSGGGSVYSVNREYDPVANSWQLVKSLPVAVHGTGAVTVDDKIYLLAGGTRAAVYSSDVAQAFGISH